MRDGLMRVVTIAVFVATFATLADAGTLLVSGTDYYEGSSGYGYGQANWSQMSAQMDTLTGGHVTVVPNLENAAQVSAADALWIDLRKANESLSLAERTNIVNFIATGKRVVLVGENASWTNWDNSLLGLVGSSYAGAQDLPAAPIISNSLTLGVQHVQLESAGAATGGKALFDRNWATLWGPNDNVLTVLDSGPLTDFFRTTSNMDNARFGNNVAAWVTVPEPATLALLTIALPMFLRRRKSA